MRSFLLLVLSICLIGCARTSDWIMVNDPSLMPPEPARAFRGLWVATVANIDWPSAPGLSASAQQEEAVRILDLAQDLNLNAIVLQVRPAADALYASRLEPWSAFLTGEQGQDPGYDPLEFWIHEAHIRGLELHAWINPFRAWHPSTPGEPDPRGFAATQPEFLIEHGGYLWLDPGDQRARNHSLRVIRDITNRYDIDGIHVDDYFYPYPIDGQSLDDARSYASYQSEGGVLSRSDWRRWNIDRFVRDMYAEVKGLKPHVLVGISPFGIWRPGHPEGIEGFDAYEELAADARRWLRAGWLDYAAPQLYWKVESEGQPFEPLLNWWTTENHNARHVWPGLYLTRIKADGGWAPVDITRQIDIIQNHEHADGFVLFSAIGLLENRQQVNDILAQSHLRDLALVPPSPWLGSAKLPPPELIMQDKPTALVLHISNLHPKARGVLLQIRQSGEWQSRFIPRTQRHVLIPSPDDQDAPIFIAARAIGPAGMTSSPSLYTRLLPAPVTPRTTYPPPISALAPKNPLP